jgi:hypothetical protein
VKKSTTADNFEESVLYSSVYEHRLQLRLVNRRDSKSNIEDHAADLDVQIAHAAGRLMGRRGRSPTNAGSGQ